MTKAMSEILGIALAWEGFLFILWMLDYISWDTLGLFSLMLFIGTAVFALFAQQDSEKPDHQ